MTQEFYQSLGFFLLVRESDSHTLHRIWLGNSGQPFAMFSFLASDLPPELTTLSC